jgi:uncharacterized membrane protein
MARREGLGPAAPPHAGERVTAGRARSWVRGPEGWGLGALLVFTLVALAGYGIFGMNPQLIPAGLLGFWQVSYAFFARVHIVLGAVVLAMALVPHAGMRWVPALVVVYLLSLGAEYVGTGYGLPFGAYEYTALLGAQFGGRVPWVIPLSWFLMVVPSWILARRTFPGSDLRGRLSRILFAAALLTLWDLALDPAMSYQAPYYWTWGDTGPYYGMPWINLAGWMLTGVVLMAVLELLGAERWSRDVPIGWALGYYAVTVLMPFGMLVLEGLWIGVAATLAGGLAAWAVHRAFRESGAPVAAAPAPLRPPTATRGRA